MALEVAFHEAVHASNTCDYLTVVDTMSRLGSELQDASDLLASLVSPTSEGTRSDATGKALGTALQAATSAGRRDVAWYDEARALSERALRQFERDSDRRRQAGYRAQLETDAGQLDSALAWLARCVGVAPESSAREVVEAADATGSWFDLMDTVNKK